MSHDETEFTQDGLFWRSDFNGAIDDLRSDEDNICQVIRVGANDCILVAMKHEVTAERAAEIQRIVSVWCGVSRQRVLVIDSRTSFYKFTPEQT